MIHGLELLQIEQFAFEMSKEVFHYGIIIAVTIVAHALLDAFVVQHLYILLMPVVPALVRMKQQVCVVWNLLKCLFQRRWLCVLLAVMCLGTCALVHSHGCLEDDGAVHVHRCADDCCTVCAFKSLVVCVLMLVYGRIALRRIVRERFERHGAPPEESEGTLVQLKVKLSN